MKGKRSGKNEEDFWEVDPETGFAMEKRSVVRWLARVLLGSFKRF